MINQQVDQRQRQLTGILCLIRNSPVRGRDIGLTVDLEVTLTKLLLVYFISPLQDQLIVT